MASLTPKSRSEEVTSEAMNEGLVNGAMVLLPSMAGLYAALQNPKFRKVTNWQSRTAITIMPALFVFALTSEHKLAHRMSEVAEETEHAIKSVEWAEERQRNSDQDLKLRALYRESVLNSGIRVVPQLEAYHNVANFVQHNPFKVIGGIGVPAVALIFYGRSGKEHLSLQLKLLHTRVFGQFAVICTLLGVMGLKEMMDRGGRYVTESDVEERVMEMEATRRNMLDRLEYQAQQQRLARRNREQKLKG